MFDFLKKINWKKVSLQTLFGGIAVYVGAKGSGASDTQAILAGVVSALTSGGAAVQDTRVKSATMPTGQD